MRTRESKSLFLFIGIIVMIILFTNFDGTVWAADVKSLLKEAKKELRQAERDMFGGKKDKAIAALEPIKDKLLKIMAADPNNPILKTLEKKYKKLVKDLEKRTGRDLGGGTLTAAATSVKPKLPPKPETKPMPEKRAPAPVPVTGDVQTLTKKADTLLRQAEKNLYAGKNEEAAQQINQAKTMIDKVKAEDPKHSKLKFLEKKYSQIEKKLESKKPKSIPLTARPAQPTQAKKAADTKLPYPARAPTTKAKRQLDRIDQNIQRMNDPKLDREQLLKNMKIALDNARKNFETGKAKAAEKGVTSHPDFDAVEAGIAEAEKKIAAAKESHEKAKAAAAAQAGEVKADVKALMDEYNKVKSVFERATGAAIHYNDLKPVKELLAQIDTFEKNKLGNLKPKLEVFGKKYGTTKDAIDKKAESMGYSDPYYRAGFAYTEMTKGIENVKKTRTVMADDLIRRANDMKSQTYKGIHDFYRMKQYAIVKEWGQIAAKFDPENPRVKEFNIGIDAWVKEDMKALKAKIDKATFPRQASNAPGDGKKLAAVAKEFLQKQEDARAAKGKVAGKVVAVVVTGPWRIFKKNILGEPIQYNLPIAAAVQIESEKNMNLTRVYYGTMLTEEMKGVKKAPPFIGATVGDSYYVRPSAVK